MVKSERPAEATDSPASPAFAERFGVAGKGRGGLRA